MQVDVVNTKVEVTLTGLASYSGVTATVVLRSPSNVVKTTTCTVASTGVVTWYTTTGLINEAGVWSMQLAVVAGSTWSGRSSIATFPAVANLV